MSAYTNCAEWHFADGEVLRVGDLWRDRSGPIRDTYRVKAIRHDRRRGDLDVVVEIIRREIDGKPALVGPGIQTTWPVAALYDNEGRIEPITEEVGK